MNGPDDLLLAIAKWHVIKFVTFEIAIGLFTGFFGFLAAISKESVRKFFLITLVAVVIACPVGFYFFVEEINRIQNTAYSSTDDLRNFIIAAIFSFAIPMAAMRLGIKDWVIKFFHKPSIEVREARVQVHEIDNHLREIKDYDPKKFFN